MADHIELDLSFAKPEAAGEHGVGVQEITGRQERAEEIHADLSEKRRSGALPFYNLPYEEQMAAEMRQFADDIAGKFENYVHVGIGGSSLGPKAVHSALHHPQYNALPAEKRGNRPRMFFLENVDPDSVNAVFDIIDVSKTLFNVVTKSGSTAETAAIFLVVCGALQEALGERWRENIVFTTDPENGDLRKLAKSEQILAFSINPGVGGRFSVFTPVGLLPAAISGLDISELLAGAAAMDERCKTADLEANPAYAFAAHQYLANVNHGKSIAIMFPYADALYDAADWFCQLWGESLGKEKALDGGTVNVGQTPVKALGAVDQHSQVQLYIEGPNDKFFTFLRVENFKNAVTIPPLFSDYKSYGYLGDKSLQMLLNAEQEATAEALAAHHRPGMTITFPRVSAHTLGQFFYLLEVATAFSGGLYNIDPFDQPGVEHGKILTYRKMGRE